MGNLGYFVQVTMFVSGTPTCVSVHLSRTKILKGLFLMLFKYKNLPIILIPNINNCVKFEISLTRKLSKV